jgi:hypothetical protein
MPPHVLATFFLATARYPYAVGIFGAIYFQNIFLVIRTPYIFCNEKIKKKALLERKHFDLATIDMFSNLSLI